MAKVADYLHAMWFEKNNHMMCAIIEEITTHVIRSLIKLFGKDL